ncbi:glutamate-1-semialdehyde 2,1-aminomutase [Aporhodopirellula aestuarii]|uniref:Glutamate-1-semialdehyde 2,1-aminomutase n=1 Tax=Aporhodopirellula aestuarii TaxID=2950107 RepID=A0ABT0UEM7_9BACT|nr:glutamate-1-semialdehyde 2,1-aminomutase [Aporhodopirellula aestuarii]MCM2375140.1 glutamate-1-semialdehyde 2,1-aminomutase [Aporhodopirellula aestuarii]
MSPEPENAYDRYEQSRKLQCRAHQQIPGGCHTYAKGDDQFPMLSPGFIARGKGCHVWDVDGNEFIEYGMGCRAVTLGHAFEPVVSAVAESLTLGTNFTRPAAIEVECAEMLLSMIPTAEMCKFAKDGSTVTTAALKLARAHTGRDKIALCQDHPFFAIHDWFIGTTGIPAGIPDAVRDQSLMFRYNDPESIEYLFKKFPGQIAAIILEPAKYSDPEDHFLHRAREICHQNGALFILDEMITGFRWHNGGAQTSYDIEPDLSTFGKALANGFSASALVGKREFMQAAGLYHDRQRVFALSTTHGAETPGLAAAIATMRFYQENPVIEVLQRQGAKLAASLREIVSSHGLEDSIQIIGKPCNLIFTSTDGDGQRSQFFRALLMQELIRGGVLGPSLVISYSHSDEDIAQTSVAFDKALVVYKAALAEGVEKYLLGPPTQIVYQDRNDVAFQSPPRAFHPAQ